MLQPELTLKVVTKYLVRWKEFTVELDTWEGRENLGNAKEAIKEFKKEYQQDIKEVNWQEREEEMFRRGELQGRFMAKKLFRWSDKRYNKEYWRRLEQNWKQWKEGQTRGKRILEMIQEKEESEQKRGEIRE